MHCGRFIGPAQTRREMLARCANGFGAVALAALLGESASAADNSARHDPLAPTPTYFLHPGSGSQGRPSHGSWVSYGLGSVSRDLPGFVVLNCDQIPPGGADCFGSGFLPATYQGSVFRPGASAVANIRPSGDQAAKLALLRSLDREH